MSDGMETESVHYYHVEIEQPPGSPGPSTTRIFSSRRFWALVALAVAIILLVIAVVLLNVLDSGSVADSSRSVWFLAVRSSLVA